MTFIFRSLIVFLFFGRSSIPSGESAGSNGFSQLLIRRFEWLAVNISVFAFFRELGVQLVFIRGLKVYATYRIWIDHQSRHNLGLKVPDSAKKIQAFGGLDILRSVVNQTLIRILHCITYYGTQRSKLVQYGCIKILKLL